MARRQRYYDTHTLTIYREEERRGEEEREVETTSPWFDPRRTPEDEGYPTCPEVLFETRELREVEYEVEFTYTPAQPAYTGRDESRWSPGADAEIDVVSVTCEGRVLPYREWPDLDDIDSEAIEEAEGSLEAAREAAEESRWEARREEGW